MIEKSIHCLVLGHHDITMNVQKTKEDTQGAMNNVHISEDDSLHIKNKD